MTPSTARGRRTRDGAGERGPRGLRAARVQRHPDVRHRRRGRREPRDGVHVLPVQGGRARRGVQRDRRRGLRRRPGARRPARRPDHRIEEGNRRYLRAYANNARMLEVVEQAATNDPQFRELVDGLRAVFVDKSRATLARFQAEGLADPSLDPDIAGPALVGMVESFARRWHAHGETYDTEQVVATLTRLWTQAVGLRHAADADRPATRGGHGEVHRGARPAAGRGPQGRRGRAEPARRRVGGRRAPSRRTRSSRGSASSGCSGWSTTPPTAAAGSTTPSRWCSARSSAGWTAPASRWRSPCRPTWRRRRWPGSAPRSSSRRYLAPAQPRRAGLRDRGVRARRRLRRRRHPHPGATRRRRLGHHRPQALDHQRRAGRLAVPARAHVRRGRLPGHVDDRRAVDRRPGFTVAAHAGQAGQPVVGHGRARPRGLPRPGVEHDRRDRARLPAADGAVPGRAPDRVLHGGRRCRARRAPDHRLPAGPRGVRQAAAGQPGAAVPAGRAARRDRRRSALLLRRGRRRWSPARTSPGSRRSPS